MTTSGRPARAIAVTAVLIALGATLGWFASARAVTHDALPRQLLSGAACAEKPGIYVDLLRAYVGWRLGVDGESARRLEALAQTTRAQMDRWGPACLALRTQATDDPLAQLSELERLLAISQEGIAQIRPRFAAFHASLDETQRQALGRMIAEARGVPQR